MNLKVRWNVTGDERNFSGAYFFLLMGGGLQMTHVFPELSEMFLLFKQLDEDLRQNLKSTMQQKYRQPGEERVTQAVDNLQQEVQQ